MITTHTTVYEDLSGPGVRTTYRVPMWVKVFEHVGHWLVRRPAWNSRQMVWGLALLTRANDYVRTRARILKTEEVPPLFNRPMTPERRARIDALKEAMLDEQDDGR